jgi:hypothetical protein
MAQPIPNSRETAGLESLLILQTGKTLLDGEWNMKMLGKYALLIGMDTFKQLLNAFIEWLKNTIKTMEWRRFMASLWAFLERFRRSKECVIPTTEAVKPVRYVVAFYPHSSFYQYLHQMASMKDARLTYNICLSSQQIHQKDVHTITKQETWYNTTIELENAYAVMNTPVHMTTQMKSDSDNTRSFVGCTFPKEQLSQPLFVDRDSIDVLDIIPFQKEREMIRTWAYKYINGVHTFHKDDVLTDVIRKSVRSRASEKRSYASSELYQNLVEIIYDHLCKNNEKIINSLVDLLIFSIFFTSCIRKKYNSGPIHIKKPFGVDLDITIPANVVTNVIKNKVVFPISDELCEWFSCQLAYESAKATDCIQVSIYRKMKDANPIQEWETFLKTAMEQVKIYDKESRKKKVKTFALKIQRETIVEEKPNPMYEDYRQKMELISKLATNGNSSISESLSKMEAVPEKIQVEKIHKLVKMQEINEVCKDISTLYLRKNDYESLTHALYCYKEKREIFSELGLPNKLGVMIHGEPGTGNGEDFHHLRHCHIPGKGHLLLESQRYSHQ